MKRGFTLIELLIYVGIFSLAAGLFTGILVVVLRIQGQQTSAVEVGTQLNFVMQTLQRLVRESTAINSPASGGSANALSVNRPGASPTIAALSEGKITVNEGGAGAKDLTTSKVNVSELIFTHYTTPSNHPSFPPEETIQIKITMNFNTNNPTQAVTIILQSSASPLNP